MRGLRKHLSEASCRHGEPFNPHRASLQSLVFTAPPSLRPSREIRRLLSSSRAQGMSRPQH
jgi:hypothetical protein